MTKINTTVYCLLFVFSFGAQGVKAEDESVRVFFKAKFDSVVTVSKVLAYGFYTSDKAVVHYNAVDSLHTKDKGLAERICDSVLTAETVSRANHYSIILKYQGLSRRDTSAVKRLLTFSSFNLAYSDSRLHQYDASLLGKFWFSSNFVIKIGGSFGKLPRTLRATTWGFKMGVGYKEASSEGSSIVQPHIILNYLVLLNPQEPRSQMRPRGRGSFGVELFLQSTMDETFIFNVGTAYYFKDDFIMKGRRFLNSIGCSIRI